MSEKISKAMNDKMRKLYGELDWDDWPENEKLAEIEALEIRKWVDTEEKKIDEKWAKIPYKGLDGGSTAERRVIHREFLMKLQAIRKKYGIPEPETK